MKHANEYRAYVAHYMAVYGPTSIDKGDFFDLAGTPAGSYAMGLGVRHGRAEADVLTPEQFDVTIESLIMPPDASVETTLYLASQAAAQRGDVAFADQCNRALGVLTGATLFYAGDGAGHGQSTIEHWEKPTSAHPAGRYLTTTIDNVIRISRPRPTPIGP